MVLGPTHAISGAAVWLAGSWAAEHYLSYHQSLFELAIGTAVCAGAALLPDLDCSGRVLANKGGATVAHTFGVVSLFLAECVEKFSLLVYKLTRLKKDPQRHNGHRTLTHTWLFNAGLGVGVAELCQHFGKPAAVSVLFFTLALAIRGLMSSSAKSAGWIIVTALAGLAAYQAVHVLPSDRGYPLLGLSVAAGGVIHVLGDMITRQGCPVLWPLPLGRRTWREFGIPDAIAVKVGGKFERMVLRPLLFVGAVAATAVIVGPSLFAAAF